MVSLIILTVLGWQFTKIVISASPLSTDEAIKLVNDRYNGNIVKINKQNNKYEITIELETGAYVVEVNRKTGDIDSLKRTGNGVGQIKNDINKQKVEQPDTSNERVTKEEATRIALQRVSGKVDEIKIEQSNGLTYYLVEIDRKNEQEATVQINAISGEIMSITWND